MKNRIYILATALFLMCSLGTFTSCEDQILTPPDEYLNSDNSDATDDEDELDPEEPENPEEPTDPEDPTDPDKPFDYSGTYTENSDTHKLAMTYGGETISGKVVEVVFNAPVETTAEDGETPSEDQKATATLKLKGGKFNINSLLGEFGVNVADLETPGPIPGEPEYTINNIELTKEEDGYSFTSEDFNAALGRTVKYLGKFTEGNLSVDLNVSYGSDNVLVSKEFKPITEQPIRAGSWTSTNNNLGLSGIKGFLTFDQLPNIILSSTGGLINGKEINDIFIESLKNIKFSNDGCVISNIIWEGVAVDANRNSIHYYMDANNANRLYLEIDANSLLGSLGGLVMAASRAANPDDLTGNVTKLIEILRTPLLRGIPFEYNGVAAFYVEHDLLLQIAKAAAPVLKNSTVNEFVGAYLHPLLDGKEVTVKGFKVTIEPADVDALIANLPDCLAGCTDANIDFCFQQ